MKLIKSQVIFNPDEHTYMLGDKELSGITSVISRQLFPDKYRVQVDGKELDLNRKEYDILVYFMNRPGRLVNKNTMAESVWGDHIDQVDNFDFIYAQIKNLRKRLKEAGATPELKAVYGFGYKMVVE